MIVSLDGTLAAAGPLAPAPGASMKKMTAGHGPRSVSIMLPADARPPVHYVRTRDGVNRSR